MHVGVMWTLYGRYMDVVWTIYGRCMDRKRTLFRPLWTLYGRYGPYMNVVRTLWAFLALHERRMLWAMGTFMDVA